MKIIFFGSDDFAQVHLEALIASKYNVIGCVTQPDRPKGRGMKVVESPIKESAKNHKVLCLQPVDVKAQEFISELQNMQADLFVVIAYGRILTQDILDIPKICAINVHGSLLPKYRGAAPINWAIINGEVQTGLSIIKMNAKMDAGDILSKETISIAPEDTAVTLRKKMMSSGPDFLLETIKQLEEETLEVIVQDEREVSIAAKLTKDLGLIDWRQSAKSIHNLVRGLLPWPSAYTFYKQQQLKILETEVVFSEPHGLEPGQISAIDSRSFRVATGNGDLVIKTVHPQASKRMDAASFLRGSRLEIGYQFKKGI